MVVTSAGEPCIIAAPYQGALNFASFFAPKKVRKILLFFLRMAESAKKVAESAKSFANVTFCLHIS